MIRSPLVWYEREGEPANPKARAFRLALEQGLRATRVRAEWADWAADEVRSGW